METSTNLSTAHAASQLNPAERFNLYRRLAENDFGGFVREAWKILEPATEFSENWHLDLIAEYLTLVHRREIRRLIINIPPRHMKSLLCTVFFPCWVWAQAPATRFICSSYAETLSIKHSLDRRSVLTSSWFQDLWGDKVTFADDQNAKSEFLNTARGHMTSTSTGGSITGKGADIVIVDDPHNPLQALSDAERATALRYFDIALSTRLDQPKHGCIIVIMQRLHENDLTGHLISAEGWDQLTLPAEAEKEERRLFPITKKVHTRQAGELLWPERFPQAELNQAKIRLGSYAFAGQYQQRPSPADGGILQRRWWRRYDVMPQQFDTVIQSWDLSFKETKDSDYVVGQVWGKIGADKYLLDSVRDRMSFPQTCHAMRTLNMKWPQAHAKLVENKANGPAVISYLQNEIPGIIAVEPLGSKESRAQAGAPEVEAGNYHIPNNQMGDDFIEECAQFNRGAHDDQVDAWSQAAARFHRLSCGIMEWYKNEAAVVESPAAPAAVVN